MKTDKDHFKALKLILLLFFRRESSSFASRKEKDVSLLLKNIKFGHKISLIFRSYDHLHKVPAEFGTGKNAMMMFTGSEYFKQTI